MSNLKQLQGDLNKLVQVGNEMLEDFKSVQSTSQRRMNQPETTSRKSIETHYQGWYSECYELVKLMLPSRFDEFVELYSGSRHRGGADATKFGIQHWLLGMGVSGGTLVPNNGYYHSHEPELVLAKLQTQVHILKSINQRFESSLFDIRQIVRADIFDSELEAATELAKNGFTRAAGSLAGVVLEKHLKLVAENHSILLRKRNPTISDFNDALKDNGTLDTPTWRQIQRLGDIRNLCSHSKEREPTKDEVGELIAGVEKFTKTLF